MMQNIFDYINYFFTELFGISNFLVSPNSLINNLQSFWSSVYDNPAISDKLSTFIGYLLAKPLYIFSAFVWVWFAWLGLHLLLIWPFKWIRSVVKR